MHSDHGHSSENKTNHQHSHGHGHGHSHGHGFVANDSDGKNLLWATLLNVLITIAEIAGGILSNSLALLSDAFHNLGDTIAVALAYFANRFGKRSANERKTFGYKRIEILVALFNALILIIITLFLFREAWHRFKNPEEIKGLLMFVVACIGLVANLVAVLLLKRDSAANINIRAAYLHLLGDTFSSVAVIIGAILIYFFNWFWIDPLITVLIGIYIIKEAINILREAVDILMQATPRNLELEEIKHELEEIAGIDNIHHVHIWNLTDSQIHFECHVDVASDMPISETTFLRSKMETLLKNKFGVSHVTIQVEYNCCEGKQLIHKK